MHLNLYQTHSRVMSQSKAFTYYHAGPLFTMAELHTNTLLASQIHTVSAGKFIPVVPQDLEQRDTTPHSIRDQDIRGLLACDLALFTYDGAELDSGTVVEYMIAKFADIPTVILRTDFRKAGDQGSNGGDPWNLMSSFWPRTKTVVVDAMLGYKAGLASALGGQGENAVTFDAGGEKAALQAGHGLLNDVGQRVVDAMQEVVIMPSTLPKEAREHVYSWLALMPGFKVGGDANVSVMMDLLRQKEEKGLF